MLALSDHDTILGVEVERSTVRHSSEKFAVLTQEQLILVGLARAVYKDAAIYLLDGVLSTLGPAVAPLVFQDCLLHQLCAKTVVLGESLSLASQEGSLLEACNEIHLIGARRSEHGVVSGLRGSFQDLTLVQQQSDSWHQHHDLEPHACPVLVAEAEASWVLSRISKEEATLANAPSQSVRWGWLWFCQKGHEPVMLVLIAFILLFGHALRALQDWWIKQLYSEKKQADMPIDGVDQDGAAAILIASVVCMVFLLASANALWAAVVSVSATKELHRSLTEALQETSLHVAADRQQALLDMLGNSMNEALTSFPSHVQSTLHCSFAALGCLLLITVEILTIRDGKPPPEVYAFVALPVLLAVWAVWKCWSVDDSLRRVSYMMAAARGPVRSLCASTARNINGLRIYPQEGAAVETMQCLVDRYSSAQMAVYSVQMRVIIGVGLVWCFGAVLVAAMVTILKESGLVLGLEGVAVAGLILALTVQLVFLAQWAILAASDASISFHAFVGRTKYGVLNLSAREELSPVAGHDTNLGFTAGACTIENVCIPLSPSAPAALVSITLTLPLTLFPCRAQSCFLVAFVALFSLVSLSHPGASLSVFTHEQHLILFVVGNR